MLVVELVDVLHAIDVQVGDEVECNAFAADVAAAPDDVGVVFRVQRRDEGEHQEDLLDADAAREEVNHDDHAVVTEVELAQDEVVLLEVQVVVHRGDVEVECRGAQTKNSTLRQT